MPHPTDIRRYTEKWLDILEWFEDHPSEPYVMECETAKRCHSLRFEFYRAREAARKNPEMKRAYPNMDRREAIIDGLKLIFRFKETTPVAELLQKSLDENNARLERKHEHE